MLIFIHWCNTSKDSVVSSSPTGSFPQTVPVDMAAGRMELRLNQSAEDSVPTNGNPLSLKRPIHGDLHSLRLI